MLFNLILYLITVEFEQMSGKIIHFFLTFKERPS